MIWLLLIFILIIAVILIILVKKKVFGKRIVLIFGVIVVICACIGGLLMYKFIGNNINPNWIIMVERSGIDGLSNKVYFYSDKIGEFLEEIDQDMIELK